jgi:hypothetical protein
VHRARQVLHGGRPRDEEPHVKKSARRRKDIDYILKVDLVSGQSYPHINQHQ